MAGGERAGAVRQASEGLVASCELQEEVLIQLLPPGPLPCGQEDVAPNVLMHNAAAGGHAAESHVDVLVELDGHLRGGRSEGWYLALAGSGQVVLGPFPHPLFFFSLYGIFLVLPFSWFKVTVSMLETHNRLLFPVSSW